MSDLGNRAIMAENIQRLMAQRGKTRTEVCEDLGIKYTTFTDWVNGKTYPRIDKIELMAKYFGVSKSELVEKNVHDMAYLNDLHYNGIIAWSEDQFFSVSERIAIKKHLDELLIRYKALIEATQKCKMSLRSYLNAIEQFNSDSEAPLSKRELIKRYLAQNLEQEQKDLCAWIEAAPFYFSEAMEHSLNDPAVSTMPDDLSTEAAEALYRSSSGYVPSADLSASNTIAGTAPTDGTKGA